jgi:hypothetical protein
VCREIEGGDEDAREGGRAAFGAIIAMHTLTVAMCLVNGTTHGDFHVCVEPSLPQEP